MADHTGKRAGRRAVRRIDTSSIKTTTIISYVVFALFLVMILWGLSNFFLNSFYERARSQEVIRTAETLEAQFMTSALCLLPSVTTADPSARSLRTAWA